MIDPVLAGLLSGTGLVAAATAAADALSAPEKVAVVVIAALILTGSYLLACAIWPYANCPRCHGSGKSGAPSRKAFRNCPRCKGTGRRTRIGRRLLDHHSNR